MNLFLRRLVMLQTLKVINVSVGDSLFVLCETQTVRAWRGERATCNLATVSQLLRPDTIYTIPRNGEWSPAALGGVQVQGVRAAEWGE
jgi:hypothetical protein